MAETKPSKPGVIRNPDEPKPGVPITILTDAEARTAPTEEGCVAYLRKHNIQAMMTNAIEDLLKYQPEDPEEFLAAYFEALIPDEHTAKVQAFNHGRGMQVS